MRRTAFSTAASSARPGSTRPSTTLPLGRPRRAPSNFSTASLARSSTASVSTTRHGPSKEKPTAKLELYEYGDPTGEFLREFNHVPSRPADDNHLRYISQETLDRVRSVERLAGRTLVGTASSLVPVNGARVLLLACGRGATIASFAKLGPCSLTLVDIDPSTVRSAVERVSEVGQSATVNVFPVVSDAWSFVRDTDELYDLIVCVHSIGQIIKHDPTGIESFVSDVSALLAPGGVMIMDEHLGFTDADSPAPHSVESREDRYVATGLGGFVDDVNYLLPRVVPGCVRRADWVTPGHPHDMQRWLYMAWERHSDDSTISAPAPVSYPRLQALPVCGAVTDKTLFELTYPRAARGVKVPLARDDRRTVRPGRLMPKIDGTAAVLLFDGDVALFAGPEMGGIFYLPFVFDSVRICTAELVLSSSGDYLLFVTGVIDKDGRPVDPNSNAELRELDEFQDLLSEVGIIVNTPSLIGFVSGNTLSLPRSPAGRTVPVDGVNLLSGGRWGRFFKPSSTLSIDTSAADWPVLADELSGTISLLRPFGDTASPDFPAPIAPGPAPDGSHKAAPDPNLIYELGIRVDGTTARLVQMRRRPDKGGTDQLGKVVAFLCSVTRVTPIAAEVRNASQLIKFLNTG
uniref:Methyltransferase n=1 Tax=Exserohilum turcicum polymycovirus 2 TaxID=3229046 RepID=A0AAU7YCF6_9VIRU